MIETAAPTREARPTEPATPAPSCGAVVYLDVDGVRHVFECEAKDDWPDDPDNAPHPGQPHMVRLKPVEAGDEIFVGWWHAGE